MMKKALFVGLVALSAGFTSPVMGAGTGAMTPTDQMEWKEITPGSPVKIVVLWGDRAKGEYAMLLRLPAGFSSPIHAHSGDYHGVNIAGVWRHSFDGGEQKDMSPGGYVFQPGMGMHGDACVGIQDCIVLIHQHAKADFIPKQ